MYIQFIKQILLFIFLIWPIRIVGYILLIPISIYMAYKVKKQNVAWVKLPKWCRWYDCLENYQPIFMDQGRDWTNDDGILGDRPYREHRGTWDLKQCSIIKIAYNIYLWIGVRNKTEYLCGVLLGFKLDNAIHENLVVVYGSIDIDDGVKSGVLLCSYELRDKQYYELYIIKRYGTSNRCFRFRLGYKLSGIGFYYKNRYYVMSTLSINPFNTWGRPI